MAPFSSSSSLLQDNLFASLPISLLSLLTLFATYGCYQLYRFLQRDRPLPGYPVISLREEKDLGPKQSWLLHGDEVLRKGLASTSGPFQVSTGTGHKVSPICCVSAQIVADHLQLILPNRYADELRNHHDMR